MSTWIEKTLEDVKAAIYKARWVDSFGKSAVMPTDDELAAVALSAVMKVML